MANPAVRISKETQRLLADPGMHAITVDSLTHLLTYSLIKSRTLSITHSSLTYLLTY